MIIKKILKKPYYSIIRSRKKFRNLTSSTARILLYHRIAESQADPHLLCVSQKNFRDQIKYLKENYSVIPLVKMVQDIRTNKVKNKSVAITFDDGYADNLHNAVPILKEFNVPATIFIVAGYIGSQELFYWDKDDNPAQDKGRPMNIDEVKELSRIHLIEIGAHTMNHPQLSKISYEDQKKEIGLGLKRLKEIISMPVLSFAYPFGDRHSITKETIEIVKQAGFNYACANIHERATNGSDIYTLPRFIVRDWKLDEFKREIGKMI